MTKRETIKYWVKGVYDQTLQLLGIRISDFWLLIRAIHRDHGGEEAKALWAASICLALKHGNRNNKETRDKIIEATKEDPIGDEPNLKIKVYTNENHVKNQGTILLTDVTIDYKKLVALFGMPHSYNHGLDVKWVLCYNGYVLTIYNYKRGLNYSHKKPEDTTTWHIEGTSRCVAEDLARKITRFEVWILKPCIMEV